MVAGNYDYIMEWTFRDDGAILVRAGSTGPKIDAGQETSVGHMHNFTWRLDIDLDGVSNNSAYLTGHFENLEFPFSNSTATDKLALISVEGSRFWRPRRIPIHWRSSTRGCKTAMKRSTYYELVPMRSGTARHSEAYTKKDFWVTRYNPEQSFLAGPLPQYVRDSQPTVNQDLAILYTGSEHHENNSRDEDRNTVPGPWTGFELIPNNLFDHTPFYPASTPSPTP